MATATNTEFKTTTIAQQLRRLRRQLVRWILVEGLSRFLLALLLIALVDLFLDGTFRMDFPQRAIMLFIMMAAVLAVAYRQLFRPLEKKPNDDALILEVERKHADFQQSVISGYQLAQRPIGGDPDIPAT